MEEVRTVDAATERPAGELVALDTTPLRDRERLFRRYLCEQLRRVEAEESGSRLAVKRTVHLLFSCSFGAMVSSVMLDGDRFPVARLVLVCLTVLLGLAGYLLTSQWVLDRLFPVTMEACDRDSP